LIVSLKLEKKLLKNAISFTFLPFFLIQRKYEKKLPLVMISNLTYFHHFIHIVEGADMIQLECFSSYFC